MPFPFRPDDKTQFDRMKILLRLLRGGGDKSRRMVLLSILDLGVSPRAERENKKRERKKKAEGAFVTFYARYVKSGALQRDGATPRRRSLHYFFALRPYLPSYPLYARTSIKQ